MNIDSDTNTSRLFAAADALLAAMTSGKGRDATVLMTLSEPAFHTVATKHAFTPTELVAAMEMLIRLGLVAAPR